MPRTHASINTTAHDPTETNRPYAKSSWKSATRLEIGHALWQATIEILQLVLILPSQIYQI